MSHILNVFNRPKIVTSLSTLALSIASGIANAEVTANNDSAMTYVGESVTINVLSNDIGHDESSAANSPLSQICLNTGSDTPCSLNELNVRPTNPNNGSLSLQGTQIVYTPDAGYEGPDSFTYALFQGALTDSPFGPDADEATVTITVMARPSTDNGDPTDGEVPIDENPIDEETPVDETPIEEETPTDETPAEEETPTNETPTDEERPTDEQGSENISSAGTLSSAIDSLCTSTEDESLSSACFALNNMSPTERETALATLAGDQVSAQARMGINMARSHNNAIISRLKQVRSGTSTISVNQLSLRHAGDTINGQWLQAMYDSLNVDHGSNSEENNSTLTGGSAGYSSSGFKPPISLFVSGSITTGDKDSSTSERGFDLSSDAFMVGADYRVSRELVGGVALGLSSSELEFNGTTDDMENDLFHLYLYGSWFRDNFYVDSSLSFAQGDIDTRRRIFVPGTVDTVATGSTDTQQISLQVSAGYDLHWKNFSFGPHASIDFITGSIDAYGEANGGGFEVGFDKQDLNSFLVSAGGQASYQMSFDWGVLIPHLKMDLKTELDDSQDAITGRFLLDSNNQAFTISANKVDTFWFQTAFGTSAVFPYGLSAYVEYDFTQGLDRQTISTYSYGGRWELDF